MKFNFKSIVLAFAAAVSFVACDKAAVDPIEGIYSAPENTQITTLTSIDYAKEGKNRLVTLNFGGAKNVSIQFVSKTYALAPTTYTEGLSSNMKPGLYNADCSTVGGTPISFGSVTLTCNSETNYTVSGVVQIGENTRYSIDWTGDIIWKEEEIDAADYDYVETITLTDNGTALKHTLALVKDGVQAGNIELFTEPGVTSIEGAYTTASYAGAPGQLSDGFDLSVFGMSGIIGSYVITDNGTVLFAVDDKVTISLDAKTGWYELESSNGLKFTMDKAPAVMAKVDQASGNAESHTFTLKLSGEKVVAAPNAFGGFDYTGEGAYISIDFYSEDGKLAAGSYEFGETVGPGICTAGYIFSDWGFPLPFGSWAYTVDGSGTAAMTEGNVEVSVSGDVYTIAVKSNAGRFSFTGKLS